MAEKEKRRATTFRTSRGAIVNVQYPDIYIAPSIAPVDVTSPAEMKEALREEVSDLPIEKRFDTPLTMVEMNRLHQFGDEELILTLSRVGEIWRLKTGHAWELIHTERTSLTDNIRWEGRAVVFGGKLYIGGGHIYDVAGHAFILAYDGSTITKVFSQSYPNAINDFYCLQVSGAYIYAGLHLTTAGVSTGKILRSADGVTWTEIRDITEGYPWDMFSYLSKLYVTVSNPSVATPHLWTFDGVSWTQVILAAATHIQKSLAMVTYPSGNRDPYHRLYIGCGATLVAGERGQYSVLFYTDNGTTFQEVRFPSMGNLGTSARPLYGTGHVVLAGAGLVMTNGMRWLLHAPTPFWPTDMESYQGDVYVAYALARVVDLRKRIALLRFSYDKFLGLFKPFQGSLKLLDVEPVGIGAILVSPAFPGSSKVCLSITDTQAATLNIQWAPNGKDFENFQTGIALVAATPYVWMTEYEAPLWRLSITQGGTAGTVTSYVNLR